jgi:hypothetical protein
MPTASSVRFESTIEEPRRGWPASLPVPEHIAARFGLDARPTRVICTLGNTRFPCAIVSSGERRFIHLSQRLRDEAGVAIGQRVRVTLARDERPSEVELPAELEEVLRQEAHGARLFTALSPGRQRGIAALLLRVKSSERRIEKALAIVRAIEQGTTDLRELARARLVEPDAEPRRSGKRIL